MPLKSPVSPTRKELPSYTDSVSMSEQLQNRLRMAFTIPDAIPVGGMVFPQPYVHCTIRDNYFAPLIGKAVATEELNLLQSLPAPVEIPLPDVFMPGTMTIANADSGAIGQFQSVVRFDGSNEVIHEQSSERRNYELYPLVSETILASMLPMDVLKGITQDKPLVVIMQNISKDDTHIGPLDSTGIQLIRDGQGVIQVADIYLGPIGDREFWEKYKRTEAETIAKSSGVFFVLGEFGK